MEKSSWSEISNRIYDISDEISGIGDLLAALETVYHSTECSDGLIVLSRILWNYSKELKQFAQTEIKFTKADNSANKI